MRIAITGANGYVGSRIAADLAGHADVVALGRREGQVRFSLGGPIDARPLADIDMLVHCAYDFGPKRWEDIERVNVKGSVQLFSAARKAGIRRIIFISSMSAFDGCRSLYGRAKLAVEQADVVSVRPGLVYDRDCASLVGKMRGIIRKLPVVPLVGGSKSLYLCHSRDLAALIRELCDGPLPKKPVNAANPQPHTFREILQILAEAEKRSVAFVPLPYWFAYAGLKAAEFLRLPVGFRSDSLVGLMNSNESADFSGTITKFRPFDPNTANQ